jgi:hypothetical protein
MSSITQPFTTLAAAEGRNGMSPLLSPVLPAM